MFETNLNEQLYSEGFRFYYWPYYKYNNNEFNILYYASSGKPILEGNAGYKLSDFYGRYSSFKDECLNNASTPFELTDFLDTLTTAQHKCKNIIHLKRFKCGDYGADDLFHRCYGISAGSPITAGHILSVLLYTNFTDHSYTFSSTYRKNHLYESVSSLKKRHSEYFWWGKYLRETVEIYGEDMKKRSDIRLFHHGISQTLYFNTTNIRLFGPVSTTTGLFLYYTFIFYLLYPCTHIVFAMYRFYNRMVDIW